MSLLEKVFVMKKNKNCVPGILPLLASAINNAKGAILYEAPLVVQETDF